MNLKKTLFINAPDIVPPVLQKQSGIKELLDLMGEISFEARNVCRGGYLWKKMIEKDDTIWLGIAGAGIAGGMGGIVTSLLQAGFIDVICSTGAQVYHDLHFAFDLPVKKINPAMDDNLLRQHGDTRIYDVGIRERETLEEQDKIIRQFVKEEFEALSKQKMASWELNYQLGLWAEKKAVYPERSFMITAAKLGVPIFWDSLSNHSIVMNFVKCEQEGFPVCLSGQRDVFDSAAVSYSMPHTGFVELGGGGPKNFIQQTGPTISQILGLEYEGAERGLQISTAVEREGSLSSCTFGEAVTWGKYKKATDEKLVQIWGEYSIIFPLLASFVYENCQPRKQKRIVDLLPDFIKNLNAAQ